MQTQGLGFRGACCAGPGLRRLGDPLPVLWPSIFTGGPFPFLWDMGGCDGLCSVCRSPNPPTPQRCQCVQTGSCRRERGPDLTRCERCVPEKGSTDVHGGRPCEDDTLSTGPGEGPEETTPRAPPSQTSSL